MQKAIFCAALFSAIAIPPMTAQHADPYRQDVERWSKGIKELQQITVSPAENERIKLTVELKPLKRAELTPVKNDKGEVTEYKYKTPFTELSLPGHYESGSTLLTKFELDWEGRKIAIPAPLWAASPLNFQIQSAPLESLDAKDIPDGKAVHAARFIRHGLLKPRIFLSADGDSVMIEWKQNSECSAPLICRWIVAKDGSAKRIDLPAEAEED